MFAINQQYQQAVPAVSAANNGWQWNGSNWVPATSTTAGHSTYSTQAYSFQPQQLQQQPAPAAAAATPNLVDQYTRYYHGWKAQADEAEQRTQKLVSGSTEHAEVQRHAQWAKYYADQSSRAAHHFHSTPNQPPAFELPPAPYAMNSSSSSNSSAAAPQATTTTTTQSVLQQQQQQPVPTKKRSRWDHHQETPQASTPADNAGPPDGLKRYVHRCLQQCTTPEQTKAIQQETEKVIAKALQKGTLHTTNWDVVDLIPVPQPQPSYMQQPSLKKQKVSPPKHQNSHGSNSSYYGPSGGGGHYGPASAQAATNPFSNKNNHHQQNSKYNKRNSDTSSQASWGSSQDFVALPPGTNGKKNKNKKQKQKFVMPGNKDDGFARNTKALAERANRFSGPGGVADATSAQTQSHGIDDRYMGKGVIGGSQKKLDETDYEHMKVKGTCQKLEKQYLRLTAPPRPELVRPLEILQQHMKNLKEEWNSKRRKRDYNWFCSEMKAVRQDLTVQHIFSPFTVDVYETHARMALQERDLNEFNQAQTQLKILYGKLDDAKALENLNEFVAYRMIYFVMMTMNKKYNGGSADMLNLMLSLTPAQREDPAIQHALKVRAAVAEVNYHQFFRLRKTCPNLGGKLMDLMVPTMRHWTLLRICKVYRPTAEVAFVLQELGFPTENNKDLKDGSRFLKSCGCIINEDGTSIDTKESVVRESDLQEKQSLI